MAEAGCGVFGLPPGVDFPRWLVDGICARMADRPPEALARLVLYVNTRRMQRRVRALFAERGALLLPRIGLVTDPGDVLAATGLPPAVPPLRRRLELAQLVARLLERQPDLAPRTAIYDLADSLAALMDEMQGERVTPEALAALDMSEHARHWARSLAFIDLIRDYIAATQDAPDREARQRLAVERLAERWHAAPPAHPVIVAGSTGSRGATAALMEAVAGLPEGMLVLPGFDFEMPGHVWHGLSDAMTAEDHPQYRFRALLDRLGAGPGDVRPWHREALPPAPARNRLVSLALRPAPVTDQWMREGRELHDLAGATAEMTLIEAPAPRAEALCIALRLRQAAETGQSAALITPDRDLARQVTAALDRWGIRPDDSAGRPLALSPPGRFLRHVADLLGRRLSAELLLILLKHPVTHGASGRGDHLRWTRDLELHLRRHGPTFPAAADLRRWAATRPQDGVQRWAEWLALHLEGLAVEDGTQPLRAHVTRHRALAEGLAAGPDAGTGCGTLWADAAGEAAHLVMEELEREADHGGALSATDYAALFTSILQGREVREPVQAHPHIRIWGTLEARVQGAELVILGGLNEGTWPQAAPPDHWLNRQMRSDTGLLLPERRIGLAAHDFQQAIAAPEVVLSRAVRDAEAQTVPSRWLNRLLNLLGGLSQTGGDAALDAMRARGARWLDMAQALEADYVPLPAAPRPAPRPPVAARPRALPVTAITRLIRDPYAIYARNILGLAPLDPLRPDPDARLRGSVMHAVFERFIRSDPPEAPDAAHDHLMQIADSVLAQEVPWPLARRMWRARLERVAARFLAGEAAREGTPVLVEQRGALDLDGVDFRLTAKPDRIDALPDGRLHIIDYKTGTPPSQKAQEHFEKQLLLEAAMAERGGFAELGPREVARISYIGLGSTPRDVVTELTPNVTAQTWQDLHRLIGRYMRREQGYAARRAVFETRFEGDYDHLARFGEWQMNIPPEPEDVG